MSELIRCENLTFSYDEEKGALAHPALYHVNLVVEEGEYVAVLGHNGSGKSTMAKLFNQILTPTEGRLIIAGKDVTAEDFSEDDLFALRCQVGMVFQNPDNQMVATTVEEDVAFGPENLGLPREELRRRVDDALECVGMTEYARHATHKLSGGQKQRVAIAGIIAMMPKCIVFDESTSMLDPLGRQEVMETMERLNRERGITILHITHYMDEAARAGRVIVMEAGEVRMDGTPKEVFSRVEEMRALGLEVPQVTELFCELRRLGYELPKDCLTVEEGAAHLLNLWKKGGDRV